MRSDKCVHLCKSPIQPTNQTSSTGQSSPKSLPCNSPPTFLQRKPLFRIFLPSITFAFIELSFFFCSKSPYKWNHAGMYSLVENMFLRFTHVIYLSNSFLFIASFSLFGYTIVLFFLLLLIERRTVIKFWSS